MRKEKNLKLKGRTLTFGIKEQNPRQKRGKEAEGKTRPTPQTHTPHSNPTPAKDPWTKLDEIRM